LGKWWTDKPLTIDETRDQLAVLEAWGNPLTGEYKINVPNREAFRLKNCDLLNELNKMLHTIQTQTLDTHLDRIPALKYIVSSHINLKVHHLIITMLMEIILSIQLIGLATLTRNTKSLQKFQIC
jgi:hypothetical protein